MDIVWYAEIMELCRSHSQSTVELKQDGGSPQSPLSPGMEDLSQALQNTLKDKKKEENQGISIGKWCSNVQSQQDAQSSRPGSPELSMNRPVQLKLLNMFGKKTPEFKTPSSNLVNDCYRGIPPKIGKRSGLRLSAEILKESPQIYEFAISEPSGLLQTNTLNRVLWSELVDCSWVRLGRARVTEPGKKPVLMPIVSLPLRSGGMVTRVRLMLSSMSFGTNLLNKRRHRCQPHSPMVRQVSCVCGNQGWNNPPLCHKHLDLQQSNNKAVVSRPGRTDSGCFGTED